MVYFLFYSIAPYLMKSTAVAANAAVNATTMVRVKVTLR
jgi:hypothetical protein